MIAPVSIPAFHKLKPVIWTSFVVCLLYLVYQDRIGWYGEFSKTEQDYARIAAADCRFHLRFTPHDWKLHRDLGDFLMKEATVTFSSDQQKKHEALLREAAEEYAKAIALNPKDAETSFTLAELYMNHWHDYRRANVFYKKCVEVNPRSEDYQRYLAISYFSIHQNDQAEIHLAIADLLEKQAH